MQRVHLWLAPSALGSLVLLGTASVAQALPGGIASPGCNGCHGGQGFDGEIQLIPQASLEPGQSVAFSLIIAESQMAAAGFLVTTGGVGTFAAGTGSRITQGALTHSRPMTATDGVVEVNFNWTAPEEPGAADFIVSAVASNVNGEAIDDRWAYAEYNWVWGCEPLTLYRDIDGDGFGQEGYTTLACEVIEGWTDAVGDCSDAWSSTYPGAPEVANGRDDNCDGEVDEGIEFALMYPDEDGDGFGYIFGTPVEAELTLEGYAPNAEDCDDTDPETFPFAEEVCDGRDNNCDRVLDDGVYERCGVGRCSRLLEVCDTECVPGEPQPELCNGLDDDCDGETDEGELCGDGEVCLEFQCRSEAEAAALYGEVTEGDGGAEGDAAAVSAGESPSVLEAGADQMSLTETVSDLTPSAESPPAEGLEPNEASPASVESDAARPEAGTGRSEEGPTTPKASEGCSITLGSAGEASGCWLLLALLGLRRRRA